MNSGLSEKYQLISRFLSGEMNPAEQQAFTRWLEEDQAHQQLLEELQLVWNNASPAANPFHAVVDEEWKKLETRMETTRSRWYIPSFTFYKVAAILVMAFGLLFIFYKNYFASQDIRLEAGNQVKMVTLPDGTHVWLAAHTSLEYGEDFGKEQRQVRLEGKGYFEVTRNEASPFVITAAGTDTRVLGTRFTLDATHKEQVDLQLDEGKVAFGKTGEKPALLLEKGQAAVYRVKEQAFSPAVYTGDKEWKKIPFDFDNTSLQQVVQQLKETFGTMVVIENTGLLNCGVTARWTDATPEQVIDVLVLSFGFTKEQQGSTWVLKGGECR